MGTRRGSKYPLLDDREWVYQKYWVERLPVCTIAELAGCCYHVADHHIKSHRFPKRTRLARTPEHIAKIQKKTKGKKRSDEAKENYRKSKTGKNNPFFGKHLSDDHKNKVRKGMQKARKEKTDFQELYNKKWLIEKYVEEEQTSYDIAEVLGCSKTSVLKGLHREGIPLKRSGLRDLKKLHIKPNKLEIKVNDILQRNFPNEWKYNGDPSVGLILANMVPDFINVNGQKTVIEVFGDFFHDPEKAFMKVSWKRQEFGRVARFSQLGYKTIILWESKIKEEGESYILEQIREVI